MAAPAALTGAFRVASPRILGRLISAFKTDEGSNNEIILSAVGDEIDESVHARTATMSEEVLPLEATGRKLDTACAGYGLERRECEADGWLRERLGREVFGPKGTREALETVLDGLFVKKPEIVEWIRDQWFVDKNYLGVDTWSCDRTKVAFRFLVRVMNTRKTIERTGFFVDRSYVGEQYDYDDRIEYSVPMWFLWILIRAVKMAGTEATIEVLN
ncbi:MAG TPA: hypothetical protein VMW93_08785 [bacterium]|nr:hypothetical protein [bacterium]